MMLHIINNSNMKDSAHHHETIRILKTLHKTYDLVGTVIQTYLHDAANALHDLADMRVRIVKGAYKESAEVAYQDKSDIDFNFIKLAKERLLSGTFTSFGTHDHQIIEELKNFAAENNIPTDQFEFQMLFGFRTNMQHQLAEEGYHFCTFITFSLDWIGYLLCLLDECLLN